MTKRPHPSEDLPSKKKPKNNEFSESDEEDYETMMSNDISDYVNTIQQSTSPQPGPSTFKCLYCSSQFETASDRISHVSEVHKHKIPTKCPYCPVQLDYYGKITLNYYIIN